MLLWLLRGPAPTTPWRLLPATLAKVVGVRLIEPRIRKLTSGVRGASGVVWSIRGESIAGIL